MNTFSAAPPELSDRVPFSSWQDGQPPRGFFRGDLGLEGRRFYEENGYLVLDRAISDTDVAAINTEAARLCRNADGDIGGTPPAPAGLSDDDVMRQMLCIHFPHKLSKVMHDALRHPAISQALTTMVGPDIKCMQSMLFLKASGKPGQAWHQDEDYIPTRDRSLVGGWIALDDATVENGCLWVIPGSQQPGLLWKQEWHADKRFDCSLESKGFPYADEDAVPVEVKKGSVVFFNGYLLHRSLPNRAAGGFRRALVYHYMNAHSLLPWRHDPNESMALTDYRDIVMVAGQDPYAWKGTVDLAKASVRTDGKSGCINWTTKETLVYNA